MSCVCHFRRETSLQRGAVGIEKTRFGLRPNGWGIPLSGSNTLPFPQTLHNRLSPEIHSIFNKHPVYELDLT